jgi:hypothetical protein
MTQELSILDTISDPELFQPWFRRPESWVAWFAFLMAVFGLPMTNADLEIFRECTGLSEPPIGGVREAWLVVGRRGGKSLMLALIAVFFATMKDWSPYLAPGERGTIQIIAADRRQARVIFRYVAALLRNVPMLAQLIERETAEQLDLNNGVTIEIVTASFRTTRGYTLIAALCDEASFWRSEDSANPDSEIIAALRPAMATVPGAMLLVASSPYARRGALWDAYRRYYGKPGPALVWQAPTRRMNPTVPESVIAEAMEADPASARAEYFAEFRTDVEGFVTREVIDQCTIAGRRELPPVEGERYSAFVDPSGGSADSFTLAVAHRDKWTEKTVLDAVREIKPPFSPQAVVAEFCGLLRSFGISRVTGDRYAGEWPREQFRLHGVGYQPSAKTKSEIYSALLPILNSNTAELLELPRLASQLIGLERRTARGGRDSIDHTPNAHDDIANAAAGALVLANEGGGRPRITAIGIDMNPRSYNPIPHWLA